MNIVMNDKIMIYKFINFVTTSSADFSPTLSSDDEASLSETSLFSLESSVS
jgi:hypothetical protein